jgi:large subunit ribosomal protein L25
MHEINLVAEPRNGETKAKILVNQGRIPAVVYGPEMETISISLDKVEVLRIMNRVAETTSIVLSLDGKEHRAFLKGVQRDKVTDSVIHLDFFIPSSGHKMELHIPIRLKGTPIGVEKGGIVDHIINELPVAVLPKDIVEEIVVDVSSFDVGHVLRVGDLEIPEGIKPLLDDEDAIMLIALPRAAKEVEEEEVEELEEDVEPEVINKGKKEEEEEE